MLPEDRSAFIRLVQEHDPVVVTLRDSNSSEVQALADLDVGDKKTLCLWNRRLLRSLKRKWIPDLGYFRVDGLQTPTLEFSSSFKATWEGKPALGQGRLFGDFDPYLGKPPAQPFDLIFADPPYTKAYGSLDDDPLLTDLIPFLAPDGLFVWEHFAGQTLQNRPGWEIVRHRTYGETGLTFLRFSCDI